MSGVGTDGMLEEEEVVVVRDPRKDLLRLRNALNGSVKEKSFRPARNEFHESKWEVCWVSPVSYLSLWLRSSKLTFLFIIADYSTVPVCQVLHPLC